VHHGFDAPAEMGRYGGRMQELINSARRRLRIDQLNGGKLALAKRGGQAEPESPKPVPNAGPRTGKHLSPGCFRKRGQPLDEGVGLGRQFRFGHGCRAQNEGFGVRLTDRA